MRTRSFENLDFSILIEEDNNLVYLQRWEEGVWGEPDRFPLPLSRAALQQTPMLSQALKSFRGDPQIDQLRDALTLGAWRFEAAESSGRLARFWAAVQASCRQLATAWARQSG